MLDSAGKAGPSPVQTLAFALAGCMGMDVVHILTKGRLDLRGLRVSLVAERAPEDPHRITAVTIDFGVTGDIPRGAGPARDRSVAREVLLGVALDAAGHRVSHARFTIPAMTPLRSPARDVSRPAARRGRAGHDRGARHRQLDAAGGSPVAGLRQIAHPRRVRRAALSCFWPASRSRCRPDRRPDGLATSGAAVRW